MLINVRYGLTDYNGERSSTSHWNDWNGTLDGLVPIVLGFEALLNGISNATVTDATIYIRLPASVNKPVTGPASAYDRLFLLCTNGVEHASFTVPAPSGLVYLTTGPFAGFKVDKSDTASVQKIEALIQALQNTQLPYGGSWITATEWEACRRVV